MEYWLPLQIISMRYVPKVSKSINSFIVLIAGYLYVPGKKKVMAPFSETSAIGGCNYMTCLE